MTSEPSPPVRRYMIGSVAFEAGSLAPGLHIVATPIGNLGDMTIRGLAALAAADSVLCEDTRTTAKLFDRYAIRTPLQPYHEHNAAKVRPAVLGRLAQGARIALVSDAGMPLVSDPGYRLVREAVQMGITVTACPGPSAVLTGLALSGLPTNRFAFFGFMPHKAGERKTLFDEIASLRSTLIFFESPHRIVGALRDVAMVFPGREIVVARELTKLHEEILRGPADEIAAALAGRPAVKGEITLLIGPPVDDGTAVTDADLTSAIIKALETMPASKAATSVARCFGLGKKDIYNRILAMKGGGDDET